LFQRWPKFRFEDPAYGNRSYVLETSGLGQSGTFGIIDRHFKNSPPSPPRWTQHAATPTPRDLAGAPTLGRFLAEMVDGTRDGFGRVASVGGNDDWSKVVGLLLRITYGQMFHYRRSYGNTSMPRGVTAVALAHGPWVSHLRPTFDTQTSLPPTFDILDTPDGDAPRGISVLHIEVRKT